VFSRGHFPELDRVDFGLRAMMTFFKFLLVSVGAAFITTLILAALARPLASLIKGLVYRPKKNGTAHPASSAH
jgi:hypothetical protein